MKKLIIISALLFSFNGWADEQVETATLKNFSIYFKHLIDVSDDLHRCAELYTAFYGYGTQNPESKISQVTKPEDYLKGAGDLTMMASGLQELLRLPLSLTPLEERNLRTLYYKGTIALADQGNKQSMVALRDDLQYCVDLVKNHDELLTEILDQYKK
tara:strand:+ start:598 stop:1071 length:474 start_codon:yes stop_codon:yes gene_type:complete